MKKIVVIIAFLILPLATFAQSGTDVAATTAVKTEVITKKVEEVKPIKTSSAIKAKLIRINYKKSNDIISIKAFRKSLHVRMKTQKLC